MSKEQILAFEDTKTNNIIRCICKKRSIDPLEFECCIEPIYRLERNGLPSLLAKGTNISDLISELRSIYNNKDEVPVIDFTNLIDMFGNNRYSKSLFSETVSRLLNMYDIEKVSEISKEEWKKAIEGETPIGRCNVFRLLNMEKENRSINANSKTINNLNIKNYQKSI